MKKRKSVSDLHEKREQRDQSHSYDSQHKREVRQHVDDVDMEIQIRETGRNPIKVKR